jgi:PIN domain nuclease of toxin-antitoxin system
MSTFFADSYAIIEMLKGNRNYLSYQSERLVMTEFNICEVGFAVCREYPAHAARILKAVRKMVVIQESRDEDYCAAAVTRMRATAEGKKLSTIDCVGYSVANRLNIPFLTGDREFADMDNVQFVR